MEGNIPDSLRLNLQEIRFSKGGLYNRFNVSREKTGMAFFIENPGKGYAAFVINYNRLDRYLKTGSDSIIRIFDRHYVRIYDSLLKDQQEVIINPFVERILDGYTENQFYNDRWESYGFIELGDESLFLSVSSAPENLIEGIGTYRLGFIFFLVIITLLALLLGRNLGVDIVHYGEGLLISKTFDNRLKFFTRFEKSLDSIGDKIKIVSELDTELNYLRNDIESIQDVLSECDED